MSRIRITAGEIIVVIVEVVKAIVKQIWGDPDEKKAPPKK